MSDPQISIAPVPASEMATVRDMFREYADWLQVDLCFQNFEQELAELPGRYAPPGGGLWFARVGGELAGIVGLRPLDAGRCELKRLWVRDAYRGHGLGRRLTDTAIAAARAAGYEKTCLDTLSFMTAARALYEGIGFEEIPAYYDNPEEDVRYLQLDLQRRY